MRARLAREVERNGAFATNAGQRIERAFDARQRQRLALPDVDQAETPQLLAALAGAEQQRDRLVAIPAAAEQMDKQVDLGA